MSGANPSSGSLGGAILSNVDIIAAAEAGDIRIEVADQHKLGLVAEEGEAFFDNRTNYVNALDRNTSKGQDVERCLESTGYRLLPFRFYDRKDGEWKLIPKRGYVLRPGNEVVIEPRQYIGLGEEYCAMHLARFTGQLSGVIIATGLIQPGWGENWVAPIYTFIRNVGTTDVTITSDFDHALTRLVFYRVSRKPRPPRVTPIQVVRAGFLADEKDIHQRNTQQAAAKMRQARIQAGAYVAVFAAVLLVAVSSLYWLPIVVPAAGGTTRINPLIGEIVVGIVVGIILGGGGVLLDRYFRDKSK